MCAGADLGFAANGDDGRHGGVSLGVPVGDDEDVVDLSAGEAGGFAVGLREQGGGGCGRGRRVRR